MSTLHRIGLLTATVACAGALGSAMPVPRHGRQSRPRALFPVEVGGKTGYIDRLGTIVIPPRFEGYLDFTEGLALVRDGKNRFAFIDTTGQVVLRPPFDIVREFSEGLAAVNTGQRRDSNLGLILEPGTWGYIDRTGKVAIPLRYTHAESFSEGLAGVNLGEQGGFIDHRGKLVFTAPLDVSEGFHGGVVLVQSRGEESYYNRAGRRLPTANLVRGSSQAFSEGLAAVQIGEKWGYMDTAGTVVIPPTFLAASNFSEGLAAVEVPIEMVWCPSESGNSRWGTPKRYGYIDRTGKLVIPPLSDYAAPFSEGLATITICSTASYIDRNGKTVLTPPFRTLASFRDGLASVESDAGRGYIDQTGKLIWKPSR